MLDSITWGTVDQLDWLITTDNSAAATATKAPSSGGNRQRRAGRDLGPPAFERLLDRLVRSCPESVPTYAVLPLRGEAQQESGQEQEAAAVSDPHVLAEERASWLEGLAAGAGVAGSAPWEQLPPACRPAHAPPPSLQEEGL